MPPFNVMVAIGQPPHAPMKAHLHHAAVDVDEFHVSPIGLEGGANAFQHFLYFWSHRYTSSISCCLVITPPSLLYDAGVRSAVP